MTEEDMASSAPVLRAPMKVNVSLGAHIAFIFMAKSFSPHSRHQPQSAKCVAAMRFAYREPSAADVMS
jgi:hypothetical protein